MSDSATWKEQILAASKIDDPIACPACCSQSLVLYGVIKVPRREILQEGKVISAHQQEDPPFQFDVVQMECMDCMTRTFLKDDNLLEMETINLNLRELLIHLTGKDPLAGKGASIC